MKVIFLCTAFLIGMLYPFQTTFAQKNDYVWVFPYNNVIDFKRSPLAVDSLPVGDKLTSPYIECAASVSDQNGNLRFYLSPQVQNLIYADRKHIDNQPRSTLRNAFGEVVENGDSIKTDVSTSQCLLLPLPGTTDQYVFLSVWNTKPYPQELQPAILCYSVIDGSANNGKGKVIQKNIPLSEPLFCQSITAVRHANGKDWWILLHDAFGKGKLYKYLLTEKGFSPLFSQTGGKIFNPDEVVARYQFNVAGQFAVSPQGDKVFLATSHPTLLYDFDRCTGILSLKTELTARNSTFSPDGNLLYTTRSFRKDNFNSFGYIQQYDLNARDITQSVMNLDTFVVDRRNAFPGEFDLELAPDNKIYFIAVRLNEYLRVLERPNVRGKGCTFKDSVLKLNNQNEFAGGFLPNMPNYRLGPMPTLYRRQPDIYSSCPNQRVKLGNDTAQYGRHYKFSPSIPNQDSLIPAPFVAPSRNTQYIRYTRCTSALCTLAVDTFVVLVTPNPNYKTSKSWVFLPDCPKDSIQIGNIDPRYTYRWEDDSTQRTGFRWVNNSSTKNQFIRTTYSSNNFVCPVAGDTFDLQIRPAYLIISTSQSRQICQDDSLRMGDNQQCDSCYYRWLPRTGLKNPNAKQTIAKPTQTTTYVRSTYIPNGCVVGTDTVFIRMIEKHVPPCTSVSRPEPVIEKPFTIYPNPAQKTVTIRYPVQNHYHLTLLDITGRELLSFKLNLSGEHTFDVSTLPEGVYILQAEDRLSEKLVIVR